jgi:hypothetical protein
MQKKYEVNKKKKKKENFIYYLLEIKRIINTMAIRYL